MRIGSYQIDTPVVLAPMAGVTDRVFRHLAHQFGLELSFAEMQTANPMLRDSKKSRLRLANLDEPAPRAVQLLGNDPEVMANAARYNITQGAGLIDINMGCPAKKVCKKAAGSALLGEPHLVEALLTAVVKAAGEVPVTLKIRTGLSPEQRNGVLIAKIAEAAGIQALTVHGRTRACKFAGAVEYDTIAEIKHNAGIPVIANGDITSLDTARQVLSHTQADAVMVGRATLGQPWWAGHLAHALKTDACQIMMPAPAVQADTARAHFRGIVELYGEADGVRIARKHIRWYFERYAHAVSEQDDSQIKLEIKPWTQAFNRTVSLAQGLDIIDAFYTAASQAQTGLMPSEIAQAA